MYVRKPQQAFAIDARLGESGAAWGPLFLRPWSYWCWRRGSACEENDDRNSNEISPKTKRPSSKTSKLASPCSSPSSFAILLALRVHSATFKDKPDILFPGS